MPFPPGGTSDILARALGQMLTDEWGRPVVPDNRPGAAGNIASEYVARARGDGCTLYVNTVGTHAMNPAVYEGAGPQMVDLLGGYVALTFATAPSGVPYVKSRPRSANGRRSPGRRAQLD